MAGRRNVRGILREKKYRAVRMKSNPEPSTQEVLAGLVERVIFHNPENGFCVLRAKALDLTTARDAASVRSDKTHARPMAAKRAPAQDVPSVSAVRRSLIVSTCLTRSAVPAGPSSRTSHSSRSRVRVFLGVFAFESLKMVANFLGRKQAPHFGQIEEAPWRRSDGHGRRRRNSSVSRRPRSFGSRLGLAWSLRAGRNDSAALRPSHAAGGAAHVAASERSSAPPSARSSAPI